MQIKITRYIKIPIEFTATVTQAEKATHDCPGCKEELQDITAATDGINILESVIAQIIKDEDLIEEDFWVEVERLKEEASEV